MKFVSFCAFKMLMIELFELISHSGQNLTRKTLLHSINNQSIQLQFIIY